MLELDRLARRLPSGAEEPSSMSWRRHKERQAQSREALRNGLRQGLISISEKSIPATASFADAWEEIAGLPSTSVYDPGVQLMEQGSCCSYVYFVRRGLIKLKSIDLTGRETIIGVRCTGALIGFEAAITGKPHLATAVTITRCCLQRFAVREFCQLIRREPELSWRLHQLTASELREVSAAIADVKSHTAYVRLKRLLLELVPELLQADSAKNEISLPVKHWEIAQMLGVTPEHLSRLLRRLEKEGFLEPGSVLILPTFSSRSHV